MKFGERLKVVREAKQLTRRQLAAKVGVSYDMVKLWELGYYEPRQRNRDRLAEVLDAPGLADAPAALSA